MRFEVGKHYKTRSGKKVKVISLISDRVGYPIVAQDDIHGFLYSVDLSGSCANGYKDPHDIVDAWKESRLLAYRYKANGALFLVTETDNFGDFEDQYERVPHLDEPI